MFDEIFKNMGGGQGNCQCNNNPCNNNPKPRKCSTSCDVLWIIILLMIVLKGGFFGLDLCTLIILFIIFGKDIMCKFRNNPCFQGC